jgi:hypothetical protein
MDRWDQEKAERAILRQKSRQSKRFVKKQYSQYCTLESRFLKLGSSKENLCCLSFSLLAWHALQYVHMKRKFHEKSQWAKIGEKVGVA